MQLGYRATFATFVVAALLGSAAARLIGSAAKRRQTNLSVISLGNNF
jgi:hypothetical protein